MKVNFASGSHPFTSPWVNVDMLTNDADYQFDLRDEEWPDEINEIDIAYVGHFLEHITKPAGIDFLTHLREMMTEVGQLFVVGPDVKKADALGVQEPLRTQIGRHSNPEPGHGHLWNCSVDVVMTQLETAGWTDIKEKPIRDLRTYDIPMISPAEWQFLLVANAQ